MSIMLNYFLSRTKALHVPEKYVNMFAFLWKTTTYAREMTKSWLFKKRIPWSYFLFLWNWALPLICIFSCSQFLIHSHLDNCNISKQNIIHSIQKFTVLFVSHVHLSSLQKLNFIAEHRRPKAVMRSPIPIEPMHSFSYGQLRRR